MQQQDILVTPFFKAVALPDPAATKKEGRPIFRDMEVVEIRIAGDRHYAPVVPAHSMWERVDGEEITYAMRWPDAFERFKAGQAQVAHGTPLSELPFLTEARRQELRALKVYTAEALAALDGKNLGNIGMDGRDLKAQAQEYIKTAATAARDVELSAENERLRAEIAALRAGNDPETEKAELKAQIAAATGATPRGNPSVETLRAMLAELTQAA